MTHWWDLLFAPGGFFGQTLGTYLLPGGEITPTKLTDEEIESDDKIIHKDFLFWEAAILGSIVAAPALYAAYTAPRKGKRKKRDDRILTELNDSSNRAVGLLASIGPAIGFPMAYMSIQGLEARGVISKGLGNTIQTLMAGAVVGQAASSITGLIGAVKR